MDSNRNNSGSHSVAPPPTLNQPGESVGDIESVLGEYHKELRKKINDAKTWSIAGERTFFEFKQFAKFSQEIRLKIWNIAVNDEEPRIVNVYCKDAQLRCKTITPRVIHACSDSRRIALKQYHRVDLGGSKTVCFINFEKDVVLFDITFFPISIFGSNPGMPIFQEKCRKLALQIGPLRKDGNHGARLDRFAKLEQLYVVTTSIRPDGYERHGIDADYCGRNVSRLTTVPDDDPQSRLVEVSRHELKQVVDVVGIPECDVVDVHREGYPKMMKPWEKERARQRREKERELIAPIRADQEAGFRLQWALDVRKVEVDVEEMADDRWDRCLGRIPLM